jgi:prophage regulatory protein
MGTLPTTGYLRLPFIIGDAKKGIIGIFPVSRSSWYEGIKAGKYPQPVNLGGGRSVAWKVEDIRALLDSQNRAA